MTQPLLRCAVALACALGLASDVSAETGFADATEWEKSTTDPDTREMLKRLLATHAELGRSFALQTRLLVSDSDDINAFATVLDGEKLVVLNLGLILAFQDDQDAVAAVLAHELAHHAKNHIKSGKTKRRVLGILGVAAGAVLDHTVGAKTGVRPGDVAYDATGLAANLLSSKFSRDQERQADSEGVAKMVAAGYGPGGSLRLHQFLLAQGGGKSSFLSSHPGGQERIENLRKLIAASPDAQKLSAKPQVALYTPSKAPASTGSTVAPGTVTPDATLLEPIDGVSLARYAAISNEIMAADGAPGVYAKIKVTEKQYDALTAKWTDRMRTDTTFTLSRQYAAMFLDASTGRFAAYGKSTARMMRGEEVPNEDPPLPMADFIAASKALRPQGTPEDYMKWARGQLAPWKLSYYEWYIIQQWWMQRMTREPKLLVEYAGAISGN